MNQNALVFADGVLVPVACDYLSLVGVRQVIRTVKNVNQLLHHPVQIWGVLPTFYDCARAHLPRGAGDDEGSLRRSLSVADSRDDEGQGGPFAGADHFRVRAGIECREDYLRVVERMLGGIGARGTGTSTETLENTRRVKIWKRDIGLVTRRGRMLPMDGARKASCVGS